MDNAVGARPLARELVIHRRRLTFHQVPAKIGTRVNVMKGIAFTLLEELIRSDRGETSINGAVTSVCEVRCVGRRGGVL